MYIRSSTALRNDYDSLVSLAKSENAPIYITRNGNDEMVFVTQQLWEQREAELSLLAEMLRREQNMLAGAKTFTMREMRGLSEGMINHANSVAV